MTTAVFTGVGVLAPTGIGTERYWAQTLAGRVALAPIPGPEPDSAIVAGTVDFAAAPPAVPARIAVQTDRWTQFGLTASQDALADARLDPAELADYELGVVTGSSSGGNEFGQHEMQKLWGQGPDRVSTY